MGPVLRSNLTNRKLFANEFIYLTINAGTALTKQIERMIDDRFCGICIFELFKKAAYLFNCVGPRYKLFINKKNGL